MCSNPVLLSILTDSLTRSSIKHLRVNSRCLIGYSTVHRVCDGNVEISSEYQALPSDGRAQSTVTLCRAQGLDGELITRANIKSVFETSCAGTAKHTQRTWAGGGGDRMIVCAGNAVLSVWKPHTAPIVALGMALIRARAEHMRRFSAQHPAGHTVIT